MPCCNRNTCKFHKRARNKESREFREQRDNTVREYAMEKVASDQNLKGSGKIDKH